MKINTPIFLNKKNNNEKEVEVIVVTELNTKADEQLPYRWNKKINAFEFIDGKIFHCPMSTDIKEK